MKHRVVLDASAFDVIDTPRGRKLRDLLVLILNRGGDVRCAAVTLAEVSQGAHRTQRASSVVARDRAGRRVIVVPTDEALARLVGSILHATHSSSADMADAHVVAVCAGAETAIVITGDGDDIVRLATAVPGTRIVSRTTRVG